MAANNGSYLETVTAIYGNVTSNVSHGSVNLTTVLNSTQLDNILSDGSQNGGGGSSLEENATYKAAMALLIWSLPVVIVFGTIGNIFSFILMLQREMRQTSTFFYLATLAVADTLVLYVSAMRTWIRTWSGFELLHISDSSCKVLMFLTYFGLHYSAWLIVAVTVERFIVVWFPLKATSICSTRRAKVTTLVIGIILLLLNGHLFWTAELLEDYGQCAMLRYHQFLYKEVLPWLHLTVYSFVPFISLLVFNMLIIVSLVKHRQVLTSTMTKDDRRTHYNHRKLAITLLCISFVWIITTTPSALYTVLPLRPQTLEEAANYMLIKIICYIIMYINHSINFLLYCITGQNFRHEFVKFLCRIRRFRKKPNARLTFRTSHSGSGQETSYPLMENMYSNRGRFCFLPFCVCLYWSVTSRKQAERPTTLCDRPKCPDNGHAMTTHNKTSTSTPP